MQYWLGTKFNGETCFASLRFDVLEPRFGHPDVLSRLEWYAIVCLGRQIQCCYCSLGSER